MDDSNNSNNNNNMINNHQQQLYQQQQQRFSNYQMNNSMYAAPLTHTPIGSDNNLSLLNNSYPNINIIPYNSKQASGEELGTNGIPNNPISSFQSLPTTL